MMFRMNAESREREERTTESMPKVWHGVRRWLLVALVALGVIQANLALIMSLTVGSLLDQAAAAATPDPLTGAVTAAAPNWGQLAVLVGSVLGIGLARWAERVVAEELGQNYVFEQRRRLIASALFGNQGNKSLGVIVTRASNDLTAVRNWIAQGIVPLLTGLPLIIVILVVLAFVDWRVGIGVAIPLFLTALAVPPLSAAAFRRARALRRVRGRMSSYIADTVRAGESIRVSGATIRELNAVDRNSAKVVSAAVHRAKVTGFIRALTVTAASLATVAVVVLSMFGIIDAAGVASVMTLLGVIATPMGDLGRVVEYRQNYRAARRVLAPILGEVQEIRRADQRRRRNWPKVTADPATAGDALTVRNLEVNGVTVPDLTIKPGERVLMRSAHPDQVRSAVRDLLDPLADPGDDAEVRITGLPYELAPAKARRELVGFASQHVPLEHGSAKRLVSYRQPDTDTHEIQDLVRLVGLSQTVAEEEAVLEAKLKNDGANWHPGDVARLKLARAVLGTPPLLVLEHLDAQLDAEGLAVLREVLENYPGGVLIASHDPQRIDVPLRVWELDGETPEERARTADVLAARSQDRGEYDERGDDEDE